jgi:hypothetical protein
MAAAADAARADSLARFEASVAQRSSDRETARLRGAIAEAGMHVYLKMLLKDNFIHAGGAGGFVLGRGGGLVCIPIIGVRMEGFALPQQLRVCVRGAFKTGMRR